MKPSVPVGHGRKIDKERAETTFLCRGKNNIGFDSHIVTFVDAVSDVDAFSGKGKTEKAAERHGTAPCYKRLPPCTMPSKKKIGQALFEREVSCKCQTSPVV